MIRIIIHQSLEQLKQLEHQQALDQMRIKGRVPKKKRIRNKIKKQNKHIQILDEFHLIKK